MKDGGKVNIDLIKVNPSYRERDSQWAKSMDLFLKNSFIKKTEPVRIIVRKNGSGYVLVAGHHLLKAARECGFKKVCVDVIGAGVTQRDYLDRFAEIIADYSRKSRKTGTFQKARAYASR